VGLVVNIAAFLVLHGADRESLNVRGAMLHVLGDLLGSAAAILAALVILWTGWTPIDPLLSVLVAVLILRSAWFLVGESGHILLEAAPKGLDVRALRADLVAAIPGVEDVHHVHAWSLPEDKRMATLHVRVAETAGTADAARISAAVKAHLRERYRIEHATVEVEGAVCGDAGRG
jgi:cobalt-zinc-cadmium efflux system protein